MMLSNVFCCSLLKYMKHDSDSCIGQGRYGYYQTLFLIMSQADGGFFIFIFNSKYTMILILVKVEPIILSI